MNEKIYEDKAFIQISNSCIEGWHECTPQEFLANHDPYTGELDNQGLKWVGKKVPADLMGNVLALVKHYPTMEVDVCLYYSDAEGWLAHVPNQKGNPVHVTFSDEDYDPPKGYHFMGTIHTHPNMGAFWSGTDQDDQRKKTGVHIVLSLKDGNLNDYKVMLSYNGRAYEQDKSIVEIPDLNSLPEASEEWLSRVNFEWDEPKEQKKAPSADSYMPEIDFKSFESSSHYDYEDRMFDLLEDPPFQGVAEHLVEYMSEHMEDIQEDLLGDMTQGEKRALCIRLLEEIGEGAKAVDLMEADYQSDSGELQ